MELVSFTVVVGEIVKIVNQTALDFTPYMLIKQIVNSMNVYINLLSAANVNNSYFVEVPMSFISPQQYKWNIFFQLQVVDLQSLKKTNHMFCTVSRWARVMGGNTWKYMVLYSQFLWLWFLLWEITGQYQIKMSTATVLCLQKQSNIMHATKHMTEKMLVQFPFCTIKIKSLCKWLQQCSSNEASYRIFGRSRCSYENLNV